MREDEFRRWLRDFSGREAAPQSNALSRCRKVERYEGDLDVHFAFDSMESLIGRLAYSSADERVNALPRHSIPINGRILSYTSSLKDSIKLYKRFRDGATSSTDQPARTKILNSDGLDSKLLKDDASRSGRISHAKVEWPSWGMPSNDEILQLARLTVPFIRFLDPELVRRIVQDNETHRSAWSRLLGLRGIDPATYLWERCSCTFPGVRRYSGSAEVAQHSRRSVSNAPIIGGVMLDDNHYPKQLWSYLLRGRPFQNFGPTGYALAHLADHKKYKSRSESEFEIIGDTGTTEPLPGLYTCATNMAYIPSTLIKPTDFAGPLRNLLQRRALYLYGNFCNVMPPTYKVRSADNEAWSLDAFDWSDEVGSAEYVEPFLAFREAKINELLERQSEA